MTKIITKKLFLPTIALAILFGLYFFPNSNNNATVDLNDKQLLNYTYTNYDQTIYLIDSNNYVSKTTIAIDSTKETITKATEIIESLIIDGKKQDIIPNGFSPIIPSDTSIKNITIENDTVKINFSTQFLTIHADKEEQMIEAIVYSLTSIDGINNVIILVDNNILTNLPHSKKTIPPVLNRDYGINKTYDLNNTNDISKVTVYYVNSYNETTYYTPITKYSNNSDDKIKIIIDELSSTALYESNLMSFLNTSTKLVEYNITDATMNLHFNNFLFDSMEEGNILEEVMYTILLSIKNNYDIETVGFFIDEQEITIESLLNIY